MSVNDSIIISVHWNRYVKMPKNHTSTSEVLSQLFCQHGDSYAISKHGQSTLSNTMSSYSVCKTSSELLPQVQLTLSFSSVLVDCLQSGCQTVEPLGGVKRRKILTQIKTDDSWSWKQNPFTASDCERGTQVKQTNQTLSPPTAGPRGSCQST